VVGIQACNPYDLAGKWEDPDPAVTPGPRIRDGGRGRKSVVYANYEEDDGGNEVYELAVEPQGYEESDPEGWSQNYGIREEELSGGHTRR
jgi:hypothetical protein